MTFGSLFSGGGGFDLGFKRAGFECLWTAENNRIASSILNKLGAPNLGDVYKIDPETIPVPDVVIWGSPCQDLSKANPNQAGLKGNRSKVFYEGIRIIESLRRRGLKLSIWENVEGAIHSNKSNDFRAVLQSFLKLGPSDIAWRVLDAQFFGVPQTRRRIFLVVNFGAGSCEQILCDADRSRLCAPSIAFAGVETPAGSRSGTLTARKPGRSARPEDLHWGLKTQRPANEASPGYMIVHPAICTHPTRSLSIHSTLLAQPPRDCIFRNVTWINPDMGLRWRTPLESERLMGWPDNWTKTSVSGKVLKDGSRYRITGNGVAEPVAFWIAVGCRYFLEAN